MPVRVAVVQRGVPPRVGGVQVRASLDDELADAFAVVLRGDDQRRVPEPVAHVRVDPARAQERRDVRDAAAPNMPEHGVVVRVSPSALARGVVGVAVARAGVSVGDVAVGRDKIHRRAAASRRPRRRGSSAAPPSVRPEDVWPLRAFWQLSASAILRSTRSVLPTFAHIGDLGAGELAHARLALVLRAAVRVKLRDHRAPFVTALPRRAPRARRSVGGASATDASPNRGASVRVRAPRDVRGDSARVTRDSRLRHERGLRLRVRVRYGGDAFARREADAGTALGRRRRRRTRRLARRSLRECFCCTRD